MMIKDTVSPMFDWKIGWGISDYVVSAIGIPMYVSEFGSPFESTNRQIQTKHAKVMDYLHDPKWERLTTPS